MFRLQLFLLLALTSLASAQLTISPAGVPDAYTGDNYYQEVRANGGNAPYTWSLRGGSLPPGIVFDTASATLAGIPTRAGDFRFSVVVTDSSRATSTRQYLLHVSPGTAIFIVWTKVPAVANGAISGEVELTNPGKEVFDLTFIAMAVNEIGRATALGYQRFSFGPGKQKIPFGTTLPRDRKST